MYAYKNACMCAIHFVCFDLQVFFEDKEKETLNAVKQTSTLTQILRHER